MSSINNSQRHYNKNKFKLQAVALSEASDVDDPREPYNDEIPQEMWQELFNDVDDDLSDNEN